MSEELKDFMDGWTVDPNGVKPLFEAVRACVAALSPVDTEYKGRPGISHSLRILRPDHAGRPLVALVDIIDDEPEARWLSVCFYADLVTDPEERGDVVPGGLMGEDACCFDIDTVDEETTRFLLNKIQEAHAGAAS